MLTGIISLKGVALKEVLKSLLFCLCEDNSCHSMESEQKVQKLLIFASADPKRLQNLLFDSLTTNNDQIYRVKIPASLDLINLTFDVHAFYVERTLRSDNSMAARRIFQDWAQFRDLSMPLEVCGLFPAIVQCRAWRVGAVLQNYLTMIDNGSRSLLMYPMHFRPNLLQYMMDVYTTEKGYRSVDCFSAVIALGFQIPRTDSRRHPLEFAIWVLEAFAHELLQLKHLWYDGMLIKEVAYWPPTTVSCDSHEGKVMKDFTCDLLEMHLIYFEETYGDSLVSPVQRSDELDDGGSLEISDACECFSSEQLQIFRGLMDKQVPTKLAIEAVLTLEMGSSVEKMLARIVRTRARNKIMRDLALLNQQTCC